MLKNLTVYNAFKGDISNVAALKQQTMSLFQRCLPLHSCVYTNKSGVLCGCSAGVEQSATTDQGRLLATDISVGDQVSSFPSVIWLTEV